MTGLGNTVIERAAADAHDDWSAMMLGLVVDMIEGHAADAHDARSGCRHWHCRGRAPCADAHDAWSGCGRTLAMPRSGGLRLINAVVARRAADARDAWSGCRHWQHLATLRLMLMMLGLGVDTGNAVVERPAADAHDHWSGCWHWQCRGRAACR